MTKSGRKFTDPGYSGSSDNVKKENSAALKRPVFMLVNDFFAFMISLKDRFSDLLEPIDRRLVNLWQYLVKGNAPLVLAMSVAAALILPALGSVGLWDCWEPHYAEVSREMYNRGDFWHPHWGGDWFFSKPVGLFWLEIAGFFALNVDTVSPGISPRAEWAVRLGPAILSLLCVYFAFVAISRIFNKRVALFSTVIMVTSPFYFFMSKQAITDMPFVASMSIAVFAFMLAWFTGDDGRVKKRWLVTAYAFAAFAGIMKGLPGFVLPAMVVFAYLLVTAEWYKLFTKDFLIGSLIGIPLFLLIFLPWYIVMFLQNPGNDCTMTQTLHDQFKQYWQGKNIKRCAARDENNRTFFERFFVHDHINRLSAGVHGDRGHFDYFIVHLGVGFFPWSALAPFSIASLMKLDMRGRDTQNRATAFVVIWSISLLVFFTIVTTKFHHYIFPIIPPLSVAVALYIDKFLKKREMSGMGLWTVIVVALVGVIGRDIMLEPKLLPNLFVYKYDRDFPSEVNIFWFMMFFVIAAVVLLLIMFLLKRRNWFIGALFAIALFFSAYNCWYLFNMVTPHWSQRYIFETYYRERTADAPIAAFLLNWRGETYYSKNTEKQLKTKSQIKRFMAKKPELEKYFITEQYRYSKLKKRLPPKYKENIHIIDRSNNKYYLVRVDPLTREQKRKLKEKKRRKKKSESEKNKSPTGAKSKEHKKEKSRSAKIIQRAGVQTPKLKPLK